VLQSPTEKKSVVDAPDSFPFCFRGYTEGIILSIFPVASRKIEHDLFRNLPGLLQRAHKFAVPWKNTPFDFWQTAALAAENVLSACTVAACYF